MQPRNLLCAIEGRGEEWEAICLDLDIAVQGRSFDEVRQLLAEAVSSYFVDAAQEAPADRDRLLARRVPARVRLGLALRIIWHTIRSPRPPGPDFEGRFDLPCPA